MQNIDKITRNVG